MKKIVFLLFALMGCTAMSFGQSRLVKSLSEGKDQTLVVYGTSITRMGNGPVWVGAVGDKLNGLYNNHLTLLNKGRSGECSTWALANLADSVLVYNPDAVLIEFTTNDAVESKGVSVEQCKTNTEELIARILEVNPDCEIILHTPCGYPIVASEGGTGGATPRPDMQKYNAVYEELAESNGYIWVDESAFFYTMGTENLDLLKTYTADGVHPTLKGAMEVIYPNVLNSLLTGLSTVDIPEESKPLFELKCDYFEQNSSTEMSVASAPYNWLSACDKVCESEYVYAQNVTNANLTFVGKSIRFGASALASTGSLTLPGMDLRPVHGKKIMLRVSATAGSNKTGTLTVKLDGKEIGKITAATDGNDGAAFGAAYYLFEYELTDGTELSKISFVHSRTEAAGYIYVNSIKVSVEDVVEPDILTLDCNVFTTSASTEMSVAKAPHNWLSASGMEWTSANVFAQVMTEANAYLGKSVRFGRNVPSGSTDFVPYNGSATTPELDLTAPEGKKVVIEVSATCGGEKNGTLTVDVDGNEVGKIEAATGNNGEPFGATYYTFKFDVKNGTEASKINFTHTRTVNGDFIYVNSIRVYREDDIVSGMEESYADKGNAVYPNPFVSEIYIGENNRSVEIYNLNGGLVYGMSQPSSRIDVSGLAAGSYILIKKDSSGHISSHKIMKM